MRAELALHLWLLVYGMISYAHQSHTFIQVKLGAKPLSCESKSSTTEYFLRPLRDIQDPNHRKPDNMCIALLSTAHPSYSLIVINNRDVREKKKKKKEPNTRELELTMRRNTSHAQPHTHPGGPHHTTTSSHPETLRAPRTEPGWALQRLANSPS